jgi:hypothetical protein
MVITGEDRHNNMPGPAVAVSGADCEDRMLEEEKEFYFKATY